MRIPLDTVVELAAQCGFPRAALLPAWVFSTYRPSAEAARQGIGGDPFSLLPGARSVLVAAMPFSPYAPWPAGYAEISAYYVASQRAHEGMLLLSKRLSALGARVDARQRLPLKLLGREAGFGEIGRNSLLLSGEWGSCFTLRALVTDLEPPDTPPAPTPDFPCGACRACVRACPTGALDGHGHVDSLRCLRVFMLSGETVPEAYRPLMGARLLGCEICQRACPKNARIPLSQPEAGPFALDLLLRGGVGDVAALAAQIGRNEARKERIQAQAALAAGNSRSETYLPLLLPLSRHERPAIAEHARWAIQRLKEEP